MKDAGRYKACIRCVVSCASAFYQDCGVSKACIRITEKTDKTIALRTCIRYGKCARCGEAGAISQNAKGVCMISKKLRVRCGKCVEVCPLGLIVQAAPELPPSKCIACGICAEDCPMEIPEVAESGSFSSVKQRPRAKSAGTLSHIREDCL